MRLRSLLPAVITVVLAATLMPQPAEAQLRRLREAAENAVENEAARQVQRLLREAIRCAIDDPACPQQAEESDEEVIYTDADGEVIVDDDGVPITDRQQAAERAGVDLQPADAEAMERPGEGVWANYDFVPGERVLFYEDYSDDRVGDFPRRLEFVNGSWEIVEWQGERYLRNMGPRHAAVQIQLPEALPERFTIEFPLYFTTSQPDLGVATSDPENNRVHFLVTNFFKFDDRRAGLATPGQGGEDLPEVLGAAEEILEGPVPVRVMVDGSYAKIYVDERRIGNVPNAQIERTNTLHFENLYHGDAEEHWMLLGPIRVAAGGADLYDKLEAEGRVTTRGILFATDSDRIRPESTPTLEEIGRMLEDHPDLRLRIEGHTDAEGDEAYNQDLSERRAASVSRYLMERHGVDASRLETAGLGESAPVDTNDTPEGRQNNRRVELVRLDG